MASMIDHLQYQIAQGLRVAWFGAHYRFGAGLQRAAGNGSAVTGIPGPPVKTLRNAMKNLFAEDWRNIAEGVYAMPHDVVSSPAVALRRSRAFFKDVPRVAARRKTGNGVEVRAQPRSELYPPYYLQNFHYQTDGYLSEESAALYDFQVEALFTGAADAMRRQALVPLGDYVKARDQRLLSLLDIACGTGRFLSFVKDNYPRLPVVGLDLSPAYLEEARRLLAPWRSADFVRANAESLPFDDAAQDIVTSVFLFHELPPKVRRTVIGEMARVLKPGGLLVIVDSLQFGDIPDFDGLLELFPQRFHEPFYLSYARENIATLLNEHGLAVQAIRPAYLAKIWVAKK